RRQDFDGLTGEEQAILRAADKVGAIGFCNGYGGNAFRIDYDGRPAVITSAHMLIEDNGELKCSSSQLRANAIYMPNTSYYDPDDTQANEDFYMREVGLVVPPVNVEEARERFRQGSDEYNALDYVVVFLAEDVRSDVMPNGHERGTLAY